MWSLECRHFPLSAGHDTNGNSSVTMLPVLTAAHLIHPIPWVTGWTTAHTALSKNSTSSCILLITALSYDSLGIWELDNCGPESEKAICNCLLIMASSVWVSESVGVGMQSNHNSSTVCLCHVVKIFNWHAKSLQWKFDKKKKTNIQVVPNSHC